MLKQRIFIPPYNKEATYLSHQGQFVNNKENNSLVTNMESEDQGNSNVGQEPSANSIQLGGKLLQPNLNVVNIQSNQQPPSSKNSKSLILADQLEQQISQKPALSQQPLKELRPQSTVNQKNESNLSKGSQRVPSQKLSYVNPTDNKENNDAFKPIRTHSYSIQPLSNGGITSTTASNTSTSIASINSVAPANLSYQSQEKVETNQRVRENIVQEGKRDIQRDPRMKLPLDQDTCLNQLTKEPVLEEKTESEPQISKEIEVIEKKDSSKKVEDSEETISGRLARVMINEGYSLDILNHFKSKEFKIVPKNCLLRHSIPSSLRARMIDWMIEVMKSYKCSEETFFMSVRVMDLFLEKSKKQQPIFDVWLHFLNRSKTLYDMHLIGVTSMFISSKFEEIFPIKLSVLQDKIAHNKLSEDDIKNMEAEILATLNFNLLGTSPYDIAMQTLTLAGYQERFSTQEFQYGHKICLYLSKMALYDYEFNKTAPYSLLAASVIYIIFKIFEQINFQFAAELHIKHIITILKVDSRDLVYTSTRILHLAKNFEYFFPDLPNLKKFNGFEMKSNDDFQH